MNALNAGSPLFRFVLAIVCLTAFTSVSLASAIYEYRESGSTAVIGTLELAEPPASNSAAWSTLDPSDLISLFLEDAVFGLGTGNLFLAVPAISVFDAISSNDGSALDTGGIGLTFPTITPSNPADPTIDRTLVLAFDAPANTDAIRLATVFTYPDQSTVVGDLFADGNWTAAPTAAIPEPGTFALLGIGFAAGARALVRRRARRETLHCRD